MELKVTDGTIPVPLICTRTGDGFSYTPLCYHTEWTKCAGFCDGVGKRYRCVNPALVNKPLCLPIEVNCDLPSCPELGAENAQTVIVLRADVPQPPLEDLWCTLRQGGSAICILTGVDV